MAAVASQHGSHLGQHLDFPKILFSVKFQQQFFELCRKHVFTAFNRNIPVIKKNFEKKKLE